MNSPGRCRQKTGIRIQFCSKLEPNISGDERPVSLEPVLELVGGHRVKSELHCSNHTLETEDDLIPLSSMKWITEYGLARIVFGAEPHLTFTDATVHSALP